MTTTEHQAGAEYGTWTEAFTLLHHAATTGAPANEIRALEAVELDELHGWGEGR